MKSKVEFVTEDIIEKMIAALQANYERLPIGKPRTAVLQLLVPYIMNNIERGESARKIVSILNKLCYIVNVEDIENIVSAQTKDTKQDSPKRKRRSKSSDHNRPENDDSVQIASSKPNKDMSGAEKDLLGEETVLNEVVNEDVYGSARGDFETVGDLKDHHKDNSGGNDGHEKDITEHDPEQKQDTAGGIQGQLEPEQVPKIKADGTFTLDDDDDKIW